jgi:hypothetical protein
LETRPPAKDVANDPDIHYHIGKSQNRYMHIGTFLRQTEGDPATKVRISSCIPHLPVAYFITEFLTQTKSSSPSPS